MTLYKQILITILLLFAVLFVAAYSVQFSATRQYLAEQQYTNVVNTVTSLGLALTPYLETSDRVGAESVINAIFDGGFYREIRLDLLAADTRIVRENTAIPRQVPAWFMELELFDEVSHEAVLTSGWLQLGKLYVEGHPGPAYYKLWQGMSRLASWFMGCFLVTWLLLVLALRYLLKPLHQIQEQAQEIELHHFGKTIPLPATRELRDVVVAINHMAGLLEEQFREQAQEAERLRQRAFLDETSGLGNRAYFVSQAASWRSEEMPGCVALVAVDILDKIHQEEGYAARDQMVRAVADNLQHICRRYDEFALARISATEYALLLPETEPDRLRALGSEINQSVSDLVVDPVEGMEVSAVGMALIGRGDDIASLLTAADNSLNRARIAPERVALSVGQDGHGQIGRQVWKGMLERALTEHAFVLSAQAVLHFDGRRYHRELYIGLAEGSQRYGAGQFMPAVEQFRLGERLDLLVIELALARLAADPELTLAVNLTRQSCASESFFDKLATLLASREGLKPRLALDIPEIVFVQASEHLGQRLAALKLDWGIDHFGRHFDMLGKLSALRPHYVKIDHAYTSQVMADDYDDAFLAAVCRAAHNIGAVTIATRVESPEQLERLSRLHIDAYQGFISPVEVL